MSDEEKVTVTELAKHKTEQDCWVLVNGKVYDLSKFAPSHPGGPEVIWKYAGQDATTIYNKYHSASLIENEVSTSERKGPIDASTITQAWLRTQPDTNTTSQSSSPPTDKPPLHTLLNLHAFETAFRTAADRRGYAYMHSASNDLLTHHANQSAWARLWFRPRVLRDVSRPRTATRLLGCPVAMPVWICPMGLARSAGPEGEIALGRGAAAAGIVHCIAGTTSSIPIEEVVRAAPEGRWFVQMYVDRDRERTVEALRRFEALPQAKAVFVTVDLPVVSKREEDEAVKIEEMGSSGKGGGMARQVGSFIDPAFSWKDLAWLRKHTKLPVLMKGIQSAEDARMALKMGCHGIVVSNHGGRALDNAPATLMILLELRRDCPEVFKKMEVLVDGGVRRGSDVLKAIMIGATGVGVGRPFQSAIAYGHEGVSAVAAILKDELETAMQLCGVSDLASVRGDMSYLNTSELEPLLPPRPPSILWPFGGRQTKL